MRHLLVPKVLVTMVLPALRTENMEGAFTVYISLRSKGFWLLIET